MDDTYRIIVVDDERIVREAIATHIPWREYGVQIVKAANAMEALERLDENALDLALLDIKMPVMDGLELLKRIKKNKPEVECIILSGYADFIYAQEALRYGAKDYLLKPVDETALINIVLKCRDEKRKLQFADAFAKVPLQEKGAVQGILHQNYSHTVNKIIKIVDEEMANEELCLKWISSEKLFLNENYLSKMFQKEVGQKFTAYLNEKRMLLAMHMLSKNDDTMIADVAAAVGYGANSQYFSIAFKKYTGYTPTEYRRYIKGIGDR